MSVTKEIASQKRCKGPCHYVNSDTCFFCGMSSPQALYQRPITITRELAGRCPLGTCDYWHDTEKGRERLGFCKKCGVRFQEELPDENRLHYTGICQHVFGETPTGACYKCGFPYPRKGSAMWETLLTPKEKLFKGMVKEELSQEIKDKELPLTEVPEFIISAPRNTIPNSYPMMIGIPSTGTVRFEWHMAMMSMMIPVCFNYRMSTRPLYFATPTGYHVAEARNLIVRDFINSDSEWLFFIDHDVLIPPITFAYLLEHMQKREYPIISGVYYAKGEPAFPLIFRGRGAGPFMDWAPGEMIEADGVPMGCTLIHRSIVQYAWDRARSLRTRDGQEIREVFRTPRDVYLDPEKLTTSNLIGTEDLWFLERVMAESVFEKTGWKKPSKEFPFLVDTRILCKHIDPNGRQYPDAFPTHRPIRDPEMSPPKLDAGSWNKG